MSAVIGQSHGGMNAGKLVHNPPDGFERSQGRVGGDGIDQRITIQILRSHTRGGRGLNEPAGYLNLGVRRFRSRFR